MSKLEKKLYLYNTLSEKKEEFIPIDKNFIKIYVCGPTVYDRAHLGNARSCVVYDVLFRVLMKIYGAENVSYARNITDVDDKIIKAAYLENLSIKEIVEKYTNFFHSDMAFLNCLEPVIEPRATDYIKDIIELIDEMIAVGCAYKGKNGDIFFKISTYKEYGKLSKRNFVEQIAGSRIEKNTNKENVEDFVLWKSIDKNHPEYEKEKKIDAIYDGGKYGPGRPGWHIECSAMIWKIFGKNFDIHGGGVDLKFPHHENEIAQVCCTFHDAKYANYWVHNGFLMVDGQKMSKSLKNFITMNDIINQGFDGELVRYIFLMTNYNQPLNWCEDLIQNAKNNLSKIKKALIFIEDEIFDGDPCNFLKINDDEFLDSKEFEFLLDNLNTSAFLLHIQGLVKTILDQNTNLKTRKKLAKTIFINLEFLGIDIKKLLKKNEEIHVENEELIKRLIAARADAKKNKDFESADRIRKDALETLKVKFIDNQDGTTVWEYI